MRGDEAVFILLRMIADSQEIAKIARIAEIHGAP